MIDSSKLNHLDIFYYWIVCSTFCIILIALGSRLVVGHWVLVPATGVRVPSPQPYRTQTPNELSYTPVIGVFFYSLVSHNLPPSKLLVFNTLSAIARLKFV